MANVTITANGTVLVASVGRNRKGGEGWQCTFGVDALGGATVALFLSYNGGVTLIPLTDTQGNAISFAAAGVKTTGVLGAPTSNTDNLGIYATTSSYSAPITLHVNPN